MSEVIFKSKYPKTISFSNESFGSLLDKDFDILLCKMSDGTEVRIERHQLTAMWARQRNYRKLQNGFHIKVLIVK